MLLAWIYNWPTIWAFLLYITIIMAITLLGLFLFKLSNIYLISCEENNLIISIFITVVSLFLGVILTFVLVDVWNNYDKTRIDADKEANVLFILYQTVSNLPNTENIQELIIEYLEYIINVGYPALGEGKTPKEGEELLAELENAIYAYRPSGDQQSILYNQAIDLVNQASSLQIDRLASGTIGVNSLIWWVMILDAVLLVILSWFLSCTTISHYILTAIVTIYVASAIFMIVILSFPFRGYMALTPEPFEEVLDAIES